MAATQVLTHRGLDPSKKEYFAESSREAFEDQLSRGYGLEFDIRRTKDDHLVIIHDSNLKRMTNGDDERAIADIPPAALLAMDFHGSHLASFRELRVLIERTQSAEAVSALHLKSSSQEERTLDILLNELVGWNPNQFIIFDVKIETARYLKQRMPELRLVPSVAHPYDIERYGSLTGDTLLSVEEVLANRDLFHGVWLDEWDRADRNGGTKAFYTAEVFKPFRDVGLAIYLVTPELHGTSPGLLGGEAHEDARDHETLMKRIAAIIALKPDGVCTDYPDEVRAIAGL